jgi:hypothetical protein
MSDLRINDIDGTLLARLKSEAAILKITLREYVISILAARARKLLK